jgi:uncharacterized peroxidase-related enzyme
MTRITPVNPTTATGKTKEMLDAMRAKVGRVPNMPLAMAAAPAVLEGYLGLSGALAHGALPPQLREQLALTVAQAVGCTYCVAGHTVLATRLGLSEAELLASRRGTVADPQTAAALAFARALVREKGAVSAEEVHRVQAAGYGDEEVAEIIAHVALNLFTSYFSLAVDLEVDFPPVLPLSA